MVLESGRPFDRKFKFGKDGKPFYVQGPNDDAKKIMNQLAPLVQEVKADFLTVIDESHATVPQLGGMYAGDRSRKTVAIFFKQLVESLFIQRFESGLFP